MKKMHFGLSAVVLAVMMMASSCEKIAIDRTLVGDEVFGHYDLSDLGLDNCLIIYDGTDYTLTLHNYNSMYFCEMPQGVINILYFALSSLESEKTYTLSTSRGSNYFHESALGINYDVEQEDGEFTLQAIDGTLTIESVGDISIIFSYEILLSNGQTLSGEFEGSVCMMDLSGEEGSPHTEQ